MKRIIPFLGGTLLLIGAAIVIISIFLTSSTKTELMKIEIQGIQFFMSQDEIESMYGPGPYDSPGCFGCGMEFLYPELNISGRYSETLGRGHDHSRSPKVKRITTTDSMVTIFGIHVRDVMLEARKVLSSNGFKLQKNRDNRYYNYFHKDDVYIRLWSDDQLIDLNKDRNIYGKYNDIVKSITIEYRVKDDENIIY